MTDITMPRLSDSMEEGTVLSWLKADGDEVAVGDDLVEIETDKATVTHPAEAAGALQILVAEGESAAVGTPIARLLDAAIPAPEPEVGAAAPAATTASAPRTETAAAASASSRGPVATPLARRVAEAHGVALAGVSGTGPMGRITRADVLSHAGVAPEPAPAPPAAAPASAPRRDPGPDARPVAPAAAGQRREPTRLQQVIARRMVEAKATIPHFQVQTEVVMDAAIALRSEIKAVAGDDPVPSYNDIIIKAAAAALRAFPLANASYQDGVFVLHDAVNVGMAVAAEDALVVPTVVDAAAKSLGEIARETRRLAASVRAGDIAPADLSGGTFTVSNLGMYGMTAITPVINPPQAAILGVGALRSTLARVDGEIVDRTLLTLTLSCDHRILYGAEAAGFLAHVRDLLETPLRLAL